MLLIPSLYLHNFLCKSVSLGEIPGSEIAQPKDICTLILIGVARLPSLEVVQSHLDMSTISLNLTIILYVSFFILVSLIGEKHYIPLYFNFHFPN